MISVWKYCVCPPEMLAPVNGAKAKDIGRIL